MIKFNHRHFVQRLLVAAALPLGSLAGGAVPAHAGSCVIAIGANGLPGLMMGGAGGTANATAATSGDPSNCATATGGTGGPAIDFGRYGGTGGESPGPRSVNEQNASIRRQTSWAARRGEHP